tara:strand:- start:3297 stop:3701 length:405 start_codon:yes stop_codon:yes gene_type:complete
MTSQNSSGTGLAASLPLRVDPVFGVFRLNTDYLSMVTQNFTMLLKTLPGERIWNPDFGVGIQTYLFELNAPNTYANLTDRINSQVKRYMPFIQLNDISFAPPENNADLFPNTVAVVIQFTIVPLQTSTTVVLEF